LLALFVAGCASGALGLNAKDGSPVDSLADVTDAQIVIAVYSSASCHYCDAQYEVLREVHSTLAREGLGKAVGIVILAVDDGDWGKLPWPVVLVRETMVTPTLVFYYRSGDTYVKATLLVGLSTAAQIYEAINITMAAMWK